MPKGGMVCEESYKAAADYRTKQYYCMKFSGTDGITLCAAATDVCIGILQTDPNTGEYGRVAHVGRIIAAVDGTTDIAAGDWLGTDANGVLVKKATADYGACAIACKPVTTNGVVFVEVLFIGPGFFRTAGG